MFPQWVGSQICFSGLCNIIWVWLRIKQLSCFCRRLDMTFRCNCISWRLGISCFRLDAMILSSCASVLTTSLWLPNELQYVSCFNGSDLLVQSFAEGFKLHPRESAKVFMKFHKSRISSANSDFGRRRGKNRHPILHSPLQLIFIMGLYAMWNFLYKALTWSVMFILWGSV